MHGIGPPRVEGLSFLQRHKPPALGGEPLGRLVLDIIVYNHELGTLAAWEGRGIEP